METKSLLYGIIGFFLGGLLVSVAATTFDKPTSDMSRMTSQLDTLTGDDYDRAFITNMVDHHQSAIAMAKLSAKNAKHTEIKQLSSDIAAAQEKEINTMRHWQKTWGYKTTSSDHKTNH